MTQYNSFSEVPTDVSQIPDDAEVWQSGRKWKWYTDGTGISGRWVLFSDSSVGDLNFEAESPVQREISTDGDPNSDEVSVTVTHFFDMAELEVLTDS